MLGVGIELRALRGGGDSEGAVDEVGHDCSGGVEQGVGLHLPLGGGLIVHRADERLDPLDVGQAVREDESASPGKRGHRSCRGQQVGDGFGDFLGVEVLEVEHHRDHFTGANAVGFVAATQDAQGSLREFLEREDAQEIALFDNHLPLHRQDHVERVEGLRVVVGVGVVEGDGARNVEFTDHRLARHLGEALDDIGIGDSIELEPDVLRVGRCDGRSISR